MAVFLFDKIIFGPVRSRRLGLSLGVNLLPDNKKYCNYNCVYCECGWTNNDISVNLPSRTKISQELEKYLKSVAEGKSPKPDVITFAGNGEPTLHPDFDKIIDDTILLRDKFIPKHKIAVLTNATNLHKERISQALKKIEMPILKIDTAIEKDFQLFNAPINSNIKIQDIIENIIKNFQNPIIQTMFIKAEFKDSLLDNTSPTSLEKYFHELKRISPSLVMIYSIARDTPMEHIYKIDFDTLSSIAKRINELGFETLVTP